MLCILVGSHWSKDAEERLVLSSAPVLESFPFIKFPFIKPPKEKPFTATNLQSQTAPKHQKVNPGGKGSKQ